MANSVHCRAQVALRGKTGIELEALTAVQVRLLTIYDMCKAVDRGMVMTDVRVLEKHGEKAGTGRRSLAADGQVRSASLFSYLERLCSWSGQPQLLADP